MDKSRAYSFLTVKAVSEEKRIITGMATTPEADRVGDIVDPLGATFADKLPLLWMHQRELPVGTVKFGTPTKEGIPFEAHIPVISEPSQLKARIEEAWQSVKHGLVRAVSIGFRGLDYDVIEATGGLFFKKIEILELSLVTVPANGGATIETVKSYDAKALAALGETSSPVEDKKQSGASDKQKPIKLTPKEGKNMDIVEQIKAFQSERAAKVAKMEEIMTVSADKGESLDAEQSEQYDALEVEVKEIDKHLSRLEALQSAQTKTPVKGDSAKAAKSVGVTNAP